ncbi:MAG TPA: hypothetical protein VG269_26770 [Tepidisphaeraceae bacterium]|nr:hypothetical protein [Tepidisphaeraceae bacterium]
MLEHVFGSPGEMPRGRVVLVVSCDEPVQLPQSFLEELRGLRNVELVALPGDELRATLGVGSPLADFAGLPLKNMTALPAEGTVIESWRDLLVKGHELVSVPSEYLELVAEAEERRWADHVVKALLILLGAIAIIVMLTNGCGCRGIDYRSGVEGKPGTWHVGVERIEHPYRKMTYCGPMPHGAPVPGPVASAPPNRLPSIA